MSFFGQYPYYTQQRRSHPVPPLAQVHHQSPPQLGPGPFGGSYLNLLGGEHSLGQEHPPTFYNTLPYSHTQVQAPSTHLTSIDDEERAAIAHLRSIQRRKEVDRIIREEAERERVIAELQEREREAAIIARVRHERELAAARARAEYEKKLADARARVDQAQLFANLRKQEEQRRLAIANEQQQQAQVYARRQLEQKRQQQQQQQQQQQRQQHALLSAALHAQEQEGEERRRQCARQCGARRSVPAPVAREQRQGKPESVEDGLEGLNRLLGSLFGIQFDTESKEEEKSEAPAAVEKKESITTPNPVAPKASETPTKTPSPAPATPTTAEKKSEFPDAINNLLSNYLGLRVEPESKLGQAVSSKVPEGLNELLGQFGLEFVPDQAKAESGSQAGPSVPIDTPKAETTPTKVAEEKKNDQPTTASPDNSGNRYPFDLSEFLSGQNGLPPFVRDILGNVELAFKEQQDKAEEKQEKQNKGKGVAEGERKTKVGPAPSTKAPTPAPAPVESAPTPVSASASAPAPVAAPVEEIAKKVSSESIAKLESIASEIKLARDSFTFPQTLSFASSSNNTDSAPSLLFNKANKPYHAQNNKLLQLLLQADGVASNGDREVRRKRKEVVKLVESELEGLEKKRDELWREVKERRERVGESSDDESAGSWTTGSTFDHEEQRPVHVEDVTAVEPTTITTTTNITEAPANVQVDQTTEKDEIGKPASFAEAVKSTESTESTGPEGAETKDEPSTNGQETTTQSNETAESKEKIEKKDKEEGYELV